MDSDFPKSNLDKAELSGRTNPGLRFRNPDPSLQSDTLIIYLPRSKFSRQ